jgi:hypothetical protein
MITKILDWFLNIIGMVLGYSGAEKKIPEVILDRVELARDPRTQFFLKNTGDKTAFNISFGTIEINFRDFVIIYFEFEKLNNLHPGEEKQIKYITYIIENDGRKVQCDSADDLYSPMFYPEYQYKQNFDLKIQYYDSSGMGYLTHFSLGKDGIITGKIVRDFSIKKILRIILKRGIRIEELKYPHYVFKIEKEN